MKDFFDKREELEKGIWIDEDGEMDIDIFDEIYDDTYCDTEETNNFKTVYICLECNQNVIAFSQPFTCEEHE